MTVVRARPVAADDVGAVGALCEAARGEIAGLRGGAQYPVLALPPPGDPSRPLWVGEIDGTVVGYLAASLSGTTGVVDAVYVDPGCRSVGVGSALLAEALAWMAAAGCATVDAYALPGARQTKNFFEESGFTARLLVVSRRL
ncbi:MAG TPA: GNAT family N-acetyltransferase [Acidimicrobiales bacterium]|nr:GNAT family N-acetyltransferase [Acidimicrobiales bacterium]